MINIWLAVDWSIMNMENRLRLILQLLHHLPQSDQHSHLHHCLSLLEPTMSSTL